MARVGELALVLVLALSTGSAASADPVAVSRNGSERAAPAAGQVANELVNYGARSAFVHVAAGGRTYGAAAGEGPPRGGRDRFRIGSVTKTFVAAIVLQLAEEGKLRLDDPVERHLPGTIPLGERITLRHLLNHTSGLANYTDHPEWLARAERSRTLRPLDVLRFAAAKPREFAWPGSRFSYSNTNYAALGLVVEAVTGLPLRDVLARRILRPLGLDGTDLVRTRRLPGLRDDGTNPSVPWAAGGMVSTARDLERFFTALLNGRVVSLASLAEMERTVPVPQTLARYGLGLEPVELSCGTFWGNAGRVLDYSSYVETSQDGRRVAVVLVRGWSDRNPDLAALLCR